ncbi:MAG: hypothetical protein HQL54_07445 [Magnetococcales bacterium]|nr:hypothetical protein [Magnetococcales bacterium]
MFNKTILLAAVGFVNSLAIVMGSTGTLWAETLTKPYTFTNGNAADADQVNANFDDLYAAINTLKEQLADKADSEKQLSMSLNDQLLGSVDFTTFNTFTYLTSPSGYRAMIGFSEGVYYLSEHEESYYTSQDCSGTPYVWSGYPGFAFSSWSTDDSAWKVFKVDHDDILTSITPASYLAEGVCTSVTTGTAVYLFAGEEDVDNVSGLPADDMPLANISFSYQ